MFSGFMVHTWEVATLVAIVAGVVGFFVVLRGSAFAAHAIPNSAFAGAAGANLLALNPLLGLGVFSLLAATGIGTLGRRGRPDVATALTLVVCLALGAAFLSQTTQDQTAIFSLLFGEILGVSSTQLLPTVILAFACVLAIAALYRRLLYATLLPEIAATKGVRPVVTDFLFLVILAAATTMTVPVVGALLIFVLMTGPPAAARCLTSRASRALVGSVGLALLTVWGAIAAAYQSNWPVGFFVGTFSALAYGGGRLVQYGREFRRPGLTSSPVRTSSSATVHS